MKEIIDQLGGGGVEAGGLFEVGEAGGGDVLGRAEGVQQRALARRADAGDFVERALDEVLLAPRAVRADGEAPTDVGAPFFPRVRQTTGAATMTVAKMTRRR